MWRKLKILKKEIIFSGMLFINIFIIYCTFYAGLFDATIDHLEEKKILMISLNRYIHMFAGLILMSLTVHLYKNMSPYKAGKIFLIYISIISICNCLIVTTTQRFMSINLLIDLLEFLCSFLLLCLIRNLLHVYQKKHFNWIRKGYAFLTVCGIIFYLGCTLINNNKFKYMYKNALTTIYIVFTVIIIISMNAGYGKFSKYLKYQIRILAIGLISNCIIFIIMYALPTFAIVTFPQDKVVTFADKQVEATGAYEETYIEINMEHMDRQQAISPLIIFTGIAIVLVYILTKWGYLITDSIDDLRCYMVSTVCLIIANTCFYFTISNNVGDFIPFNFILAVILLMYSHHVCQKRSYLYDDMVEALEIERKKLSMYLHDEVLQGLIVMLHSIGANDITVELSALIADIRNVSQTFYPTIVEDLGLEEALKIFMDEIDNNYNMKTKYAYNYPQGVFPRGIALVLYRTIKELIINAIKHSGGTRIMVSISEEQGGIQCMISDDGKGFQMLESDKLLKGYHMGLHTIKKQITDLKGNIIIISDETGSRIQIYIPLR